MPILYDEYDAEQERVAEERYRANHPNIRDEMERLGLTDADVYDEPNEEET